MFCEVLRCLGVGSELDLMNVLRIPGLGGLIYGISRGWKVLGGSTTCILRVWKFKMLKTKCLFVFRWEAQSVVFLVFGRFREAQPIVFYVSGRLAC